MASRKQEENVEEGEAFLTTVPLNEDAVWTREGGSRKVTRYLRLALEIVMAVIIVALLVNPVYERIETKPSPVPKCILSSTYSSIILMNKLSDFPRRTVPRKTYRFLPDPQYARDDMLFDEHDTLHTLHNWIPLSSGMHIRW